MKNKKINLPLSWVEAAFSVVNNVFHHLGWKISVVISFWTIPKNLKFKVRRMYMSFKLKSTSWSFSRVWMVNIAT